VDLAEFTVEAAESLFKAIDLPTEAEIPAKLQFWTLETISDQAILTFAHHIAGRDKEASVKLEFVEDLIGQGEERGLLSADHVIGIRQVVKLLRAYIENRVVPFSAADFERLSNPSKAVIYALRIYFIRYLEPRFWHINDGGQGSEFIRSFIICLEPNHFQWHLCLYSQLWDSFREAKDKDMKRGYMQDMKKALEEAMRCNKGHPEVMLYFCELAVEKSKAVRKDGRVHALPWLHI
jgi:hypothetical protein